MSLVNYVRSKKSLSHDLILSFSASFSTLAMFAAYERVGLDLQVVLYAVAGGFVSLGIKALMIGNPAANNIGQKS